MVLLLSFFDFIQSTFSMVVYLYVIIQLFNFPFSKGEENWLFFSTFWKCHNIWSIVFAFSYKSLRRIQLCKCTVLAIGECDCVVFFFWYWNSLVLLDFPKTNRLYERLVESSDTYVCILNTIDNESSCLKMLSVTFL